MQKKHIINIAIVIILIAIGGYVVLKSINSIGQIATEEEAKCIGNNTILYVQTGCPHCKAQEELFGENLKYIKITDCLVTPNKCSDITHVPTWSINNKKYEGFKSIAELKQLTGC